MYGLISLMSSPYRRFDVHICADSVRRVFKAADLIREHTLAFGINVHTAQGKQDGSSGQKYREIVVLPSIISVRFVASH